MLDDKHNRGDADRQLLRHVQARLAQRGGHAIRIIDELLTTLELSAFERGELNILDASTYPTDVAVGLLAQRVYAKEDLAAEIGDGQ